MREIRKRVFAAMLAASLLFTMPGMISYAEAETVETEHTSECATVQEEVDGSEKPESPADDTKKPEADDSNIDGPENEADDAGKSESGTGETKTELAGASKEDTEKCICSILCTDDSINGDCPVCGAEDADLSRCKGEKTENSSEEHKEDAEQGDTGTEDAGTSLCAHHKEHTQDCGYSRTSEGGVGSTCTYECRICPIEDLIAALPDAVTEANAEKVRAQLDEILDRYRELTRDEQEQLDLTRCYELQEALDVFNVPGTADNADGLPPVTSLLIMGKDVINGSVTSGDGWSYDKTTNTLTLENLTITADDYPANVKQFLKRNDSSECLLNIYLKGTNRIDGIAENERIFLEQKLAMRITGDAGASLTLNGWLEGRFDLISGGITLTFNARGGTAIDYGMNIDNGAKVVFNCSYSDTFTHFFSILSNTPGGISVKNGSTLEINSENPLHQFSINGFGPLTVEDSTLTIKNDHAEGVAVRLWNPWSGVFSEDDTITIKNSTVNLETVEGLRGYSIKIDNSTINTAEKTALALRSIGGNVTVTDTTLNGLILESGTPNQYTASGETICPTDFKLTEGAVLTVPEGASFIIPEGVTLNNNGTMHIHEKKSLTGAGTLEGDGTFLIDVTADLIDIPAPLYYTGEDLIDKITLQDSLEIMGKSFIADIDGWELDTDTLGTVKESGEYTVKYIKDGQSIEKTFTVELSAADVSAKTYNGNTETDTFIVDDTITVKATPTATGKAPEKAHTRSSYTAPTAGQMAVFLNDTQISDAVSAQADGSYTMTVNASEMLSAGNKKPNGSSISLTAKFVGNNNMADAEATVDVTITADAKLKMLDGTTRYVGNLWNAFKAENSGATVTLIKDVEESIQIYNSSNSNTDLEFTLDLNGYSLYSENSWAFYVSKNCNLTIIGDGTISGRQGISIYEGTVNIKGGAIVGTVLEGIAVFNGATLTVSGDARIKGGTDNERGCGVHIINSLNVSLSGGTFSGVAGAIKYSADQGDTFLDFLNQSDTDRYAYFHGNTPITEGLVAEENGYLTLTGTVTVKPCTDHVGEIEHNENTGTHKQTCLACGLNEDAAKCSYIYTGIGTTQIGTCICGSSVRISIDNASDLIYNGSAYTPDVTVTLDGQTLTENTDYTITYQNNKNAGKASVQIKGLAVYSSIDKEMAFTIAPKSLSVVSATAEDRAYDTTNTVRITDVALEGMIEGDDVKVDTNADTDGLTGTISSADVGSYTTVTLPPNLTLIGAEKDNYTLTQPTEAVRTNVTIRKAQGTLTVSDTSVIKTYGDEGFSLNCTTDGDGTITYAVSDSKDALGNSTNDDSIITVSADGTVTVKGVGTATVTVSLSEGKNYTKSEDTLITIIVQKAEKPKNAPDSVMEVSNRIEKVKDVTLPEDWEWQTEDLDKPLEVGTAVTATAVYTGADKDNYVTDTVTIAITRSSCDHEAGDILYTGADDQAPTCTEGGLGHRECTKCGTVMETQIAVPPLGHDYESKVTKEPTVDAEGEMTYTCSRCGDTYTEPIEKKIPEGLWIKGLTPSVSYTGSAIKPEGIRVYHGSTLLREKTEYTISYKNNTKAGTAQVIVTGKGSYKGKATAEFTIEALDLSTDANISAFVATATETGKKLKPKVTVTWNGKKLKEKTDYTLAYDANIRTASTEGYDITISGKGNYTGTLVRKFHVVPKGTTLLNSAKVTGLAKSYPYQEGKEMPEGLEADLEKLSVKVGKTTLTKDDYTVRVENGNAAGTGTVVLEAAQTGAYAGEKWISFNIIGTNLSRCFITGLEKTYLYTGEPVVPEIKVYTGKNATGTQIPSDAYTVRYSNYINQGKATVTVTGIPEKGCSGSAKATYAIGRLDLAAEKTAGSITVTMPDDIKYAKGGAKPQPLITHSYNGTVRTLREGVDYTLKYSNNTSKYVNDISAGTKKPALKITGTGNYSGTITETFDIGAQDIGKLEITVADKAYNSKKKGSYYYSVPKVYDRDGKQLGPGKDYTVQYTNESTGQPIGKTDTVENGTQIRVTVTAKENSNYEGTLSRTYYVRDAKDVKDISKAKYEKIASQQYTGSEIRPEVRLYTLTGKTKNYLTQDDYEIIGYYNNVKKGTATILVRGINAYSGVKSITFKIAAADNKSIWSGIF